MKEYVGDGLQHQKQDPTLWMWREETIRPKTKPMTSQMINDDWAVKNLVTKGPNIYTYTSGLLVESLFV